jgi:hypothetical protein
VRLHVDAACARQEMPIAAPLNRLFLIARVSTQCHPPPTHNNHPPTRGLTLSDGSEAEECEQAESPFAQDDQLNRKIVLWNGNILSLKVVRL